MAIVGLGLGVTGALFRLVLLLHILCASVGFGALAFNGVYRVRAHQLEPEAELLLLDESGFVTRTAEYLVYATLVFGLLTSVTSQNEWATSQWWLSLSILLYMIELGLLHGIIHRAEREYQGLLGKVNAAGVDDRPLGVAHLEHLEQRISWGWTGFDLLFLIILYLMVFTPGHARVA
jgi:uncharacterized membrane protein